MTGRKDFAMYRVYCVCDDVHTVIFSCSSLSYVFDYVSAHPVFVDEVGCSWDVDFVNDDIEILDCLSSKTNFAFAVSLMDRDIVESLCHQHFSYNQDFFDSYCVRHFSRYHEIFNPNSDPRFSSLDWEVFRCRK